MSRPYNFCAGPAALPEPVLERAAAEMLDWHGTGMSLMEMSHRSSEVVGVTERAETSLRRLLDISDDYAVLFMQGGATMQFAAVPLNLGAASGPYAYCNSGQWARKAMKEAARYGEVLEVAAVSTETPGALPRPETWRNSDAAAYLHLTPNETIDGMEYYGIPASDAPLVADMSSTLLSRPLPVQEYGVIYAGAQKNIGPAGLTVVIVRRELYGRTLDSCPSMLNWEKTDQAGSMMNTPPTYSIYLAGLVFDWLEEQGGLLEMALRNSHKAKTLYAAIDGSDFYANPVAVSDRSWMNVPFTLADPALDKTFLAEAEEAGLLNLKGHRSVGGMRASLYNAMPQAGVDALVSFMQQFEQRHA